MAAEIQVIKGPDEGNCFTVSKYAVKIGVGTGAEIRLSDTQIRGNLLVEWKNGTYHVRNDLEFAVYLDNEVLARGESRVWFDNVVLQPSAQTQLMLQHIRDSGAVAQGRVVLEGGAQGAQKSAGRGVWILAAAGVLVGLLLLARNPDNVVKKSDNSGSIVKRSAEALQQMEFHRPWARNHGVLPEWDTLIQLFSQARVADRQGDQQTAQERYQDCARLVNGIAERFPYDSTAETDSAQKDALEAVRNLGAVLNSRLIELSRQL